MEAEAVELAASLQQVRAVQSPPTRAGKPAVVADPTMKRVLIRIFAM